VDSSNLDERRRLNRTVNPTCFSDLNLLLTDLTASVQAALRDNFTGAYLQGSFAVGDADEDSDVDFFVATVDSLSNDEVTSLNGIDNWNCRTMTIQMSCVGHCGSMALFWPDRLPLNWLMRSRSKPLGVK
jgi:hypothetical protein